MSLKGYEWLKDGKVVMSYYFKDITLYIWEDIAEQDLTDFKEYLKEHHNDVAHIKDCRKECKED